MPLSEREQRILEQLERDLTTEDPKLATAMKDGPRASFTRVALAIVGIVVGLLLLLIGVAQSQAIIGVIGFAVMLGAVVAASTPSKKSKFKVVGPNGVHTPVAVKKAPKKTSFTQRMEERWDKRQHGE